MADSGAGTTAGVSFLGLLTILFISLKLTGHIDWSWWWVVGPLWAILAALILIWLAAALGLHLLEKFNEKRSKPTHTDREQ